MDDQPRVKIHPMERPMYQREEVKHRNDLYYGDIIILLL